MPHTPYTIPILAFWWFITSNLSITSNQQIIIFGSLIKILINMQFDWGNTLHLNLEKNVITYKLRDNEDYLIILQVSNIFIWIWGYIFHTNVYYPWWKVRVHSVVMVKNYDNNKIFLGQTQNCPIAPTLFTPWTCILDKYKYNLQLKI